MSAPPVCRQPLTPRNYDLLCHLVYQHTGIVLDSRKEYLFQTRLAALAKTEMLPDLNALCDALRAGPDPKLPHAVADALTTNETFWFRDPPLWEILRKRVLPELFDTRLSQRPLRIWSAAASTGQEAYSMAITLLESGRAASEASILGTDISTRVLEQARSGLYQSLEINRGLAAPLLVKYFSRQALQWKIRQDARSLARFQLIDLRSTMSALGCFDLILCRNVLIYFDPETKKRILDNFSQVLSPNGYLILGASENALCDLRYQSSVHNGVIFYQFRP